MTDHSDTTPAGGETRFELYRVERGSGDYALVVATSFDDAIARYFRHEWKRGSLPATYEDAEMTRPVYDGVTAVKLIGPVILP